MMAERCHELLLMVGPSLLSFGLFYLWGRYGERIFLAGLMRRSEKKWQAEQRDRERRRILGQLLEECRATGEEEAEPAG